jgi:hypothetical protein
MDRDLLLRVTYLLHFYCSETAKMKIGLPDWSMNFLTTTRLLEYSLGMIVMLVLLYLFSLILFVGLPDDYLVRVSVGRNKDSAPKTGKKILGAGIFLLGLVLSIPGIPGPGFVLVGFGLVLMGVVQPKSYVGFLLRHPGVLDRINNIRYRFGRLPLRRPP